MTKTQNFEAASAPQRGAPFAVPCAISLEEITAALDHPSTARGASEPRASFTSEFPLPTSDLAPRISLRSLRHRLHVRPQEILTAAANLLINPQWCHDAPTGDVVATVTLPEAEKIAELILFPNGEAVDPTHQPSTLNHQLRLKLPGKLYIVQLDPNEKPNRVKIGFTTNLEKRLRAFRCVAPDARYFAHWPAEDFWEKTATASITVNCRHLGGEGYEAQSLDDLRTRAEAFLALLPKPPTTPRFIPIPPGRSLHTHYSRVSEARLPLPHHLHLPQAAQPPQPTTRGDVHFLEGRRLRARVFENALGGAETPPSPNFGRGQAEGGAEQTVASPATLELQPAPPHPGHTATADAPTVQFPIIPSGNHSTQGDPCVCCPPVQRFQIPGDHTETIEAALQKQGAAEAYRLLLEENDALIRSPNLEIGREITSRRTAIHSMIVRRWAEAEQRRAGYERPFAVVALGGTGRGEVTPFSDLDYALLFDDELEGNDFLLELQRQTVHSEEFRERHGFGFEPLAFALDDAPQLEGKQLNSFLDLAPVHDPSGLSTRFRERIRSTFDPFSHFLHVRSFWQKLWEPSEAERMDRFDIKNEGLRVFLAGIWTLAMDHFSHCHEIYAALEDRRDLEAYDFLLRIRSWIHLRRPPAARKEANGNHAEDVMHFDDFVTFGEMLGPGAPEGERFDFGNGVRSRLLSARRRLMSFSRGIIERELRRGRPVGVRQPIVLGRGGLVYTPGFLPRTNEERSSAALSLLLAAQRYDVPVDPSELYATFRGAGDWLVRVPELSALFHETRGSLAASFEFLAQVDGAVERLFPGYGKFESSLDARVMREKCFLRGALERRKLRALERFIADEAEQSARAVSGMATRESAETGDAMGAIRMLDVDHLTAVKLALKTKRLPLTEEDFEMRLDSRRPRHERNSSGLSGIPVEEYYQCFATEAGFSRETVEAAAFIVRNRHALAQWTATGFNNAEQVQRFVRHCGTEQRLLALYVFTCADRSEWGSERVEPARWFLMRELYQKALAVFRPELTPADPLRGSGYAEQELAVLRDFGHDFLSGGYRKHALRFGTHVLQLAEASDETGPKAALLRDGSSTMVGVAARDWRGLAACICGALWRQGIDLHQAHLFSARNYGLALDFFHISTPEQPVGASQLRFVEQAIREHRFLAPEDQAGLPPITGDLTLEETHAGHFRLRLETASAVSGLVYALTYNVFHHLGGSIHGLSAYASRGHAFISVYHDLPPGQTLESARKIVRGFQDDSAHR